MKSTVVYSNVLVLYLHLLLTHQHPQQLPTLQAPFTVSVLYRYIIFYLLYQIFIVPLLCLDRKILTIVLPLPTVFSIATCCTGS